MDDLVADFITETREGLEALDSELVRFERQPDDPALLDKIFRLIHTIKGTSGFMGLVRLQAAAHAAENVLGGFRDGVVPVSPEAVSAVLETVDLTRLLIDLLAATGEEPEGDDSALIGRLDAVMAGGAGPEAPQAEAEPPVRGPGPLINRLGGEASLDAAAETSVTVLQAVPEAQGLFADGVDRLLAALRDGLADVARSREPDPGAFGRALAEVAGGPPEPEAVRAAFEAMARALADLDTPDEAIMELRSLALPESVTVPTPPAEEADELEHPAPCAEPAPEQAAVEEVAAPRRPTPPAEAVGADAAAGTQTIRVSVDTLEHLMAVVSELVLIRNQLIQTLRLQSESPFAGPLNRLNQVTSELQEGVMTARMQPISGAWAKLPRLVRDLAQELGKKVELVLLGQETELDRQVLELIKDPLTHMIRNAADHGLETPDERRAAGKPEAGRITLSARHEGGAIVIEIADDGRGLMVDRIRAKAVSNGLLAPAQAERMSDAEIRQLIFLPGFSTAAQVTSVSGRGVGMDVVRTNIEKIGGAIEAGPREGGGARFTIRIPLTLTIVSSLIVECCGERFAVPQSSVVELVSANGGSGRTIEYINGSAVLRLRNRLLPLVSLQALLELPPGEPSGETCIVVIRAGALTFGMIVDRVFDTEEIVVKPVATVLRDLRLFAGATILGDGSVILILDPKGLAPEAGAGQGAGQEAPAAVRAGAGEAQRAILVFRAGDEAPKAAPLEEVARIEEVGGEQIERVDGRTVIQYRERLMPVLSADGAAAALWAGGERRPLLVFARDGLNMGLLVDEIVDVVETSAGASLTAGGERSAGSLVISGEATELIDVGFYWRRAANDAAPPAAAALPPAPRRLLLVGEGPSSRGMLPSLLERAGYELTLAPDLASALALHGAGQSFQAILTDYGDDSTRREAVRTLAEAERWRSTPLFDVNGDADFSLLSGAIEQQRGAA